MSLFIGESGVKHINPCLYLETFTWALYAYASLCSNIYLIYKQTHM